MGGKHIGMLGSIALLLNNILGPGIANFSSLFQQAGWLVPSMLTVFCCFSSLACSEMILATMRTIPGNQHLEKRVEFCTLCRYFFPRPAYFFVFVLFQLSMLAANLTNIVQTAQIFDYIIDDMFGDSCAMMFYPSPMKFFCHTNPSDISPFDGGSIVLSIGMLVVAMFSIPLGYWNLDDNAIVQNIALVVISAALFAWCIIFGTLGLETDRVPVIGESFRAVGGTVMFNYMFISTLPSWVCEKHPSVSAFKAVSITLLASLVCYLMVGMLGGLAFAPFYTTDNTAMSMLQHIAPEQAPKSLRVLAKFTVDAYAIAANLASIPIFSIMMRYNIVEAGMMGRTSATVTAVVAPWVASVLLYTGDGFKDVVNFAGTFTSSIVNLVVPGILFLASQRLLLREATRAPAVAQPHDATSCSGRLVSPAIHPHPQGEAFLRTCCVDEANASETATSEEDLRKDRPAWRKLAWAIVFSMVFLTIGSIAAQGFQV